MLENLGNICRYKLASMKIIYLISMTKINDFSFAFLCLYISIILSFVMLKIFNELAII